jgi:hypothetical protein
MTSDEVEAPDWGARLTDLLLGYQRTQVLYAAAVLRLADRIAEGSSTVPELAASTATSPDALGRLVTTLTGLGLLRADMAEGHVELTPMGELLRSDSERSMRQTVLAHGEDFYPVWRELGYSLRTGQPAFELVHGMPNWEYRRHHPEVSARFDAVMAAAARSRAAALLASDRLPQQGLVVDVGGGNGTLLSAVLQDRPQLRGVLVDQPHVVSAASSVLHAAGVGDRCDIVGGDFFTGLPTGGDRYVLSGVLLDWDDEHAGTILRRCREAVTESADLLVVDAVRPDGPQPDPTHLLDLHMMITNLGGRVRSRSEWETLLAANGFRMTDAPKSTALFKVMQARPTTPQ